MADIPSVSELTKLASFLAPGFIILGLRARFQGGKLPSLSEASILYALTSSAYYAVVSPLFRVEWGMPLPAWLWSLLEFGLVPVALGAVIIFVDQKGWFYKFCKWAGISIEHHTPTAWDFAFRQKRDPSYVVVRLNDGTKYYGTWTEKSFASSAAGERDLYLEHVYDVDPNGTWKAPVPPRSALICSKDISWIEMIGSKADDEG